jgi:hypothetical protein
VPVLLANERVTLKELEIAFAAVWSRGTSADPESWSDHNPASGQCAVTALVIQDYLGGELRRGEAGAISHYWNLLPSGEEVDLTRHQFDEGIEITNIVPRTRNYLLSHAETATRYNELARAVGDRLRLPSQTR